VEFNAFIKDTVIMLSVTSNQNQPPLPPRKQDRYATCPSCGRLTTFSYAGEQHWPLRVAQAVGIDPVVQLWHCNGCHSTLSEQDLR
jgi:hypothetical protein